MTTLKEAAEGATPIVSALVLETEVWCAKMNAIPSGILDLKSAPMSMTDLARQLERSLTACQAELERAREDAGRYRAWRNDPFLTDGFFWTSDAEFDRLLDAAIAAQKG
jgi:hypothetical protein